MLILLVLLWLRLFKDMHKSVGSSYMYIFIEISQYI